MAKELNQVDALTGTVRDVGVLTRNWLGLQLLSELENRDHLVRCLDEGVAADAELARDLANALGCLASDIKEFEEELGEALHDHRAPGFAGWQAAINSGRACPHVLGPPSEFAG